MAANGIVMYCIHFAYKVFSETERTTISTCCITFDRTKIQIGNLSIEISVSEHIHGTTVFLSPIVFKRSSSQSDLQLVWLIVVVEIYCPCILISYKIRKYMNGSTMAHFTIGEIIGIRCTLGPVTYENRF